VYEGEKIGKCHKDCTGRYKERENEGINLREK
jgi:hypothetical protein